MIIPSLQVGQEMAFDHPSGCSERLDNKQSRFIAAAHDIEEIDLPESLFGSVC